MITQLSTHQVSGLSPFILGIGIALFVIGLILWLVNRKR